MFTFDLSEVKKTVDEDTWEQLTTAPFHLNGERQWHHVIEAINTLSMICGFNKITRENLDDVAERIAAYQYAFGPLTLLYPEYMDDDMTKFVTRNDLAQIVGYRCNASTLTKAQFRKKMIDIIIRESAQKREFRERSLYESIARYAENVSEALDMQIINKTKADADHHGGNGI